MEGKSVNAIWYGREKDVNWKDSKGWTALHHACHSDFEHNKNVSILLAHPNIDVNQKNIFGDTPFMLACYSGRTSTVKMLLKDGRVKVNEPDNDGKTPLWCAAGRGHIEMIKWWIASGRKLDLGEPGNEKTDAIGVARSEREDEVISLLERFNSYPEKTRNEVKMELAAE
jgi:ankyrin repeat protein